jgi:hypothetical protein
MTWREREYTRKGAMAMRRAQIVALVLALALAMQAQSASAGQADDPRDAAGSPLDLKRLESSWERVGGRVSYDIRIAMWTRWTLRDLDCDLPVCSLSVDLDTSGSRRTDYVLVFQRDGSDLVAELIQLRPRETIATLTAAKQPRSAFVIVSKRLLNATKRITWSAFSQSGGMTDEAPDSRRIPLR